MKTANALLLMALSALGSVCAEVKSCVDPLHADYACRGGEDDGLYPQPDSVVLRDCGLTDDDWEDIKACLVVAGDETDTPITTLIMFGNPDISIIPEDLFEVSASLATTLTWLSISDTKISTLPPGLLEPLKELTTLSLEYNQLTTIPAGVFDHQVKLFSLFLTGNGLTELPAGIFDKLVELSWLHLYENALTSLPAGIFDALPKLTELFLSGNRLPNLPAGVFDNQGAVQYLRLHDNDLVTLPADLFEPNGVLMELRMEGNPALQCLPASTDGDVPWDGGVSTPPVCGCEIPNLTDNVCGDGIVCTPGTEGYTCGDTEEPACSNGIVGFQGANSNGFACCPLGCGKCGGSGCGTAGAAQGLGSKDCCVNGVLNNQDLCSVTGSAPCKIDATGEQTCSNGIAGFEGENDNGSACCPLGCTKCGGSGCGKVGAAEGLGNMDCCINGVLNNQELCSVTGTAPCIV